MGGPKKISYQLVLTGKKRVGGPPKKSYQLVCGTFGGFGKCGQTDKIHVFIRIDVLLSVRRYIGNISTHTLVFFLFISLANDAYYRYY